MIRKQISSWWRSLFLGWLVPKRVRFRALIEPTRTDLAHGWEDFCPHELVWLVCRLARSRDERCAAVRCAARVCLAYYGNDTYRSAAQDCSYWPKEVERWLETANNGNVRFAYKKAGPFWHMRLLDDIEHARIAAAGDDGDLWRHAATSLALSFAALELDFDTQFHTKSSSCNLGHCFLEAPWLGIVVEDEIRRQEREFEALHSADRPDIYASFDPRIDRWRAERVLEPWSGFSPPKFFGMREEYQRLRDASADTVRGAIRERMQGTGITLFLIGPAAYSSTWMRAEMEVAAEQGNELVGVYIHDVEDEYGCSSPCRGILPMCPADRSITVYDCSVLAVGWPGNHNELERVIATILESR
jgi:hypothetical protein